MSIGTQADNERGEELHELANRDLVNKLNPFYAPEAPAAAPITNFCINCKHHKQPLTGTPTINEVRCFHPEVIRDEIAYRVLGNNFGGVSCIQARSAGGTCGTYGPKFTPLANGNAKNS